MISNAYINGYLSGYMTKLNSVTGLNKEAARVPRSLFSKLISSSRKFLERPVKVPMSTLGGLTLFSGLTGAALNELADDDFKKITELTNELNRLKLDQRLDLEKKLNEEKRKQILNDYYNSLLADIVPSAAIGAVGGAGLGALTAPEGKIGSRALSGAVIGSLALPTAMLLAKKLADKTSDKE